MVHRYLKNVVSLSFHSRKCTGCGRCTEVCPHQVFDLEQGKTPVKARVMDRDLCIECGACALNCPANAIKVNAGVGCAAAVIFGWLNGTEPKCGCSDSDCC